MKAYIIILSITVIGGIVVNYFGLPIPGSIIGLLALFLFLVFRGKVSDELQEASQTFLNYFPLFLLPLGVGVVTLLNSETDKIIALVAVSFIALVFAVIITIIIMKALIGLGKVMGRLFCKEECQI